MNIFLNPRNHLFELARLGRWLPHIILAVVLTFVFVFMGQLIGGALMLPVILIRVALDPAISFDNPESIIQSVVAPQTAVEQAILLILGFGPIFLVLWVWLALVEKRPFWTIGLERAGLLLKYLRG